MENKEDVEQVPKDEVEVKIKKGIIDQKKLKEEIDSLFNHLEKRKLTNVESALVLAQVSEMLGTANVSRCVLQELSSNGVN